MRSHGAQRTVRRKEYERATEKQSYMSFRDKYIFQQSNLEILSERYFLIARFPPLPALVLYRKLKVMLCSGIGNKGKECVFRLSSMFLMEIIPNWRSITSKNAIVINFVKMHL